MTYFDANQEPTELEAPYFENSMVDELNDFAALFNAPDDPEQVANYKRWQTLSREVNAVMYNLRESAELTFPADNNR